MCASQNISQQEHPQTHAHTESITSVKRTPQFCTSQNISRQEHPQTHAHTESVKNEGDRESEFRIF